MMPGTSAISSPRDSRASRGEGRAGERPEALSGSWMRGRSGRVVLLVLCLVLLNAFDLTFTLMAGAFWSTTTNTSFAEANPIARHFIQHPDRVIAYKVALVGTAGVILLVFRRRRLTEIACWGLCCIYAVLSVIWMVYYTALATM
ncbi:MAG: DUF5658 family protein [Planctomycetota bacterium]